jgi:hypothetical protein
MRLRQIREWRDRLAVAHAGGYRLVDCSVETMLSNVTFLLRLVDERR